MPPPIAIQPLQGMQVPAGHPGRALPRLVRFRTADPALRARYDDRVLWYAAVWLADRKLLRLYGPRAENFKPLMQSAAYATEHGSLPAPRLRGFKRYAIAEFPLDRPADSLLVTLAGDTRQMTILHQDRQSFAGLNVLYTMSQNNDPDWICDWARYHHRRHGANALLLADNASTAYTPEALFERLSSLDCLQTVRVLSVPFKYGPSSAICRRASQARYLQSGIANTSRDLLLRSARAVLSCDIDEIVVSTSGRSVFDACVARRLGFLTIPGYWRFARTEGLVRIRHADHVWRDPARATACPTKYVIAPGGPVGGWSWMTHSLESLPRRLFSGAPEFWFAHCYDISTRWKEGREDAAGSANWERDADLERVFDPEPAQET